MLSIRMQRTGRKAHPMFRVVVQDSRRTPSSGDVVAYLGNYNPHNKDLVLDNDKLSYYLKNGAQPSSRVVSLIDEKKVKLPEWVKKSDKKSKAIKNPDKLRKNVAKNKVEEVVVEKEVEATTEVAS